LFVCPDLLPKRTINSDVDENEARTLGVSGSTSSILSQRRESTKANKPHVEFESEMDVFDAGQDINAVDAEVLRAIRDSEKDSESESNWYQRLMYLIENRISAFSQFPFHCPFYIFVILTLVGGILWFFFAITENDPMADNFSNAVFFSLQVIMSGGYDDSIRDVNGLRYIFMTLNVVVKRIGHFFNAIKKNS
jgi:hypothetical protein